MMTLRGCPFAYLAFLALFVFAVAVASPAKEAAGQCDKAKCGGPVKYYESLGCTPVYKNPEDCCPVRYNCDHLKERESNKCYVNGKAYGIGETLKKEDSNPCDIGCTCRESPRENGTASFICAIVDCFMVSQPGCYLKRDPKNCCPGPQVCQENLDDVPKCEVNGKIYRDGDYFENPVNGRPCYCGPDFSLEKIDQFCATPKRSYCNPEFNSVDSVRANCAPVYYYTQSLLTDCNVVHRCPNPKDKIINISKSTDPEDNADEMKCKYGNMLLKRGEELNQAVDYNSVCIRCVCDVPPLLSCQRLSDAECDVAVHLPFE